MAKEKVASNEAISATQSLIDSLRKEVKGEESSGIVLKATGIEAYDLFSGGGFPQGDFIEFVGNPGSGKTTVALQLLGLRAQQEPDAIIVIIDAERSMTNERLAAFGLDPKRVILIQKGVTVESVFNTLKIIIKGKIERKLKVPIYVLWDSIAHTPAEKELEVEDLNSALGVKAKVMDHYIRTSHGAFTEHNLTLIAINQLRDDVKMNMYAKTTTLKGLGDRTVPGGKMQYFAAFHFLLIERAGDLDGSEYGFQGYKSTATFIKNKSGLPFQKFNMIIDYHTGVNHFWTTFTYLKDAKYFATAGGWTTLKGYVDENGVMKKFRGAQAKEKYDAEPEFKEAFDSAWGTLKNFISKQINSDPMSADEVEAIKGVITDTTDSE